MVPPMSDTLLCSGISTMTGSLVSGENSAESASGSPRTSRAISMVATWNPRHTPRNGSPFSLAYLAARTLPSTPLTPNPPGISIPSHPDSSSEAGSLRNVSESMKRILTLQSAAAPEWVNDSRWLR